MTKHRTRFLQFSEITPGVVGAWRDLAGRAAEPNPFVEPQVVVPALAHLDGARWAAGLLTAWDGDRLDAVAPVAWPLRLPVAGRGVGLPAWEVLTTPYRPLGTPLVDAKRTTEAMDALLTAPPGSGRPAAVLAIRYLGDDGPVAAALDAALAGRGQQAWRTKTYQRAVLRRDSGVPVDKDRRRRHRRIRRAREELDQRFGGSRLVDRAGDPAAVEEFLRLEAAGWKGQAGTALACDPAHAAWFREVCAVLAAEGRLELLSLEVGDRAIAMECNFLAGEAAFEFKGAYDEEYATYLPGMQPLLHIADELPDSPIAWRDSCTVPDNALMNRLWPDRRTLSTVLVPLSGRAGTAALAAARRAAALAPALAATTSAVRARVGRGRP
jgi:CelD/BcsL family acetyltransferase involved in cellulose biosynthesis